MTFAISPERLASTLATAPRYVASSHQVASHVGSEAVILQIQTGVYYGLDPIGREIWNHLQQPRTVAELCQLLLAQYDVSAQVCREAVDQILQDLHQAGLVEVMTP
jgi:hypothetical protein